MSQLQDRVENGVWGVENIREWAHTRSRKHVGGVDNRCWVSKMRPECRRRVWGVLTTGAESRKHVWDVDNGCWVSTTHPGCQRRVWGVDNRCWVSKTHLGVDNGCWVSTGEAGGSKHIVWVCRWIIVSRLKNGQKKTYLGSRRSRLEPPMPLLLLPG